MTYGLCRSRRRVRRAGIPLRLALALIIIASIVAASAAASAPMRAFAISPSAMSSAAAIRRAIASAASGRFDAVIAPLAIGTERDANAFDAPAELLRQARERGLGAHLSISVNVAAAVGELPASRDHVIYQHPEWLMIPRQLAPEMFDADTRSPAYLGRLARWTRANADRVDGIYVSPLDPAASAYLIGAVTAAVGRYAADGVYLDAVDFPGVDFDYSRHAMGLFRTRMRATLSSAERARLDGIEAIDPFAYAEEFPDEWRRFRESALTDLLEQLRGAMRTVAPALSIAAGVRAEADTALRDHFQAWRSWLDFGLVDRIGYRSRASGTVLLSTDGLFAPALERLSNVQTTVGSGPR